MDALELEQGPESSAGAAITHLHTTDHVAIPIPPRGITVFVGPNNAGKSAALRDIHQHLTRAPHGVVPECIVIAHIQVAKSGDSTTLRSWLEQNASRQVEGALLFYRRMNARVHDGVIDQYWTQGPPFGELGQLLTLYVPAGGAQGFVGPVQSFSVRDEAPSQPLHVLYLFSALELRVREVARRAFRTEIVVNRFGGNQISLHVGEPPPFEGEPGLPTRAYLDQLFGLPGLHLQGDGMKSFMGMMVALIAADYPFILVDEPEAFLHPPQARLLGRLLNEMRPNDSQLFLATHDSNVLRGLLDGDEGAVTVVRLTRREDGRRASQLEPEAIRRLWADPLLRYSNILEGLFHQAVVLCESDSDCRYYGSILDTLHLNEASEILFTHCNGKHRMPNVVRALRAVEVPTYVVADFDVLRDEQPLHALVDEMGGDWRSLGAAWLRLKRALDSETHRPSRHYVRERVTELLDASTDKTLGEAEIERYRQLARGEGGWDKVKRGGISSIPQGDASTTALELLEALSRVGIYVVPVGELERWVPVVGGHGPDWVAAVHESNRHESPDSEGARAFIRPIAERALGG